MFSSAAARFAGGFAARAFRDLRNRKKLGAAYQHAAQEVVDYYENNGYPAGRENWNGIVSLLRNPKCGNFLSVGGDLALDDIRLLKDIYTQQDPTLFHLIEKMTIAVNSHCEATLSSEQEALAHIVSSLAGVQRALTQELINEVAKGQQVAQETLARFAEQGQQIDRVEALGQEIWGILSNHLPQGPSASSSSPARKLPSDEHYQVARPQLDDLAQRLLSEAAVGICGGAGVGKSLLAVRYAREKWPGQALYVSLDSGSVRRAMDELGLALNLQFDPDLKDDQLSRVLREDLSRFEGLLILDNAEDAEEVQKLRPNPGGQCKTIVTSQDEALLRAVTSADPIMLDSFNPEQARDCFRAHLGEARAVAETAEIDRLCDLLTYLPLAVDVAAATISDEGLSVSSWLEWYPDEVDQLDALDIVRAVLRLSLRNLTERARRILYAVACFDPFIGGPETLVISVAQLEAEDQPDASRELNRLRQRSILGATNEGEVGSRRYSMHRLMREVVRQEAGGEFDEYETRFFGVMAALPEFLSQMVSDNRSTEATLAFHLDAANLEKIARTMVGETPAPPDVAATLAQQRPEFAAHVALFALMYWPRQLLRQVLELAVRDTEDSGGGWLLARNLHALGELEMRDARVPEARRHYEAALPIFREIKSRLGEANTLLALGNLELREAQLEVARRYYEAALPIFRGVKFRLGEANTLKSQGDLALREARLGEARRCYDEALSVYREIKWRLGEAETHKAMGDLEFSEAHPFKAVGEAGLLEDRLRETRVQYETALMIFGEIEFKTGQANTLRALGGLELQEGRLEEARRRYEGALRLFREIPARRGEANTTLSIAVLASWEGKGDDAVQGFRAAHDLHQEIGDLQGLRAGWGDLGQHYLRQDQPFQALEAFQTSLEAMPREGEPASYRLLMQGQLEAFANLDDEEGVLSCLRLMANLDEGLEEPYTNMLVAFKERSPNADYSDLEQALAEEPEEVWMGAVYRALGHQGGL